MTLEEFKAKCEERNIELSDKMIEQFNTYAAYLKEYNEKINLRQGGHAMRKRYKNVEAGRSRREAQKARRAGRTRAPRAAGQACPVRGTCGAPPGWTAL